MMTGTGRLLFLFLCLPLVLTACPNSGQTSYDQAARQKKKATHFEIHQPNAEYPNDKVIVTAVPDPGWFFVQWSGDLAGDENPEGLCMDSDKVIVAHFATDTPDPVAQTVALIESAQVLLDEALAILESLT